MSWVARFLVVWICAVAMVTSNAAWNVVHAEKASHEAGLHHGDTKAGEAASDHHPHAKKPRHVADASSEPEAGSTGTHHSNDASESCCAVACAGAMLAPTGPELEPKEFSKILHSLAVNTIHAAGQAPQDRPPKHIELIG